MTATVQDQVTVRAVGTEQVAVLERFKRLAGEGRVSPTIWHMIQNYVKHRQPPTEETQP